MKEIKAIIQPFMLNHVLDALREIEGLPAVTVSEVQGIDVERGVHDPVTKTKLEVMVPDELAEAVLGTIQAHARTGKSGDGRIFVIPVEETVKIRTGERSEGSS
jgi:nitrogen regulatory protein P-II 1